MNGYVVIAIFLLLVLMKVPVSMSFLVPSAIYMLVNDINIVVAIQRATSSANSFTMIAIPLFIYAGCLMNYSGVSDYLLKICRIAVGRFRGALAYCNILTSLVFAGTSGSALADLGGIGKVVMYAMKNDGYSDEDSIGITAASSTIGPIFPPSIPLMVYAMAAEASSSDLLVAGIIPAMLIVGFLCVHTFIIARKRNFPKSEMNIGFKETVLTLFKALPAFLIPVFLIAGMSMGKFGATALAAISCILTILFGVFFYRGLTWENFKAASSEALRTGGNILLIICCANVFAYVLTVSHVTNDLANLLLGISRNPTVVLLLIVVFESIMGMFIDATAAILITTPILLPITTVLGISPIQLGLVMVLTLMIGLLTPPVGMSLYMLSDVAKTPLPRVIKSVLPYYIPLYGVLLLLVLFPELTTVVPNLFATMFGT